MVFGLILGAEQGRLCRLGHPGAERAGGCGGAGPDPRAPLPASPGDSGCPPQVAIMIRFLFIFTAAYKPELQQGWLGNASLENENKKIISNPSKAARIETQKGKVKKNRYL